MGLGKKNTAARDGARRGLSGQRNQIGGVAAMGAGRALFLLPAGDGPGKGFAGIGLQSPMAGHAKGKGLPDFRREEGPTGFGTDEIFLNVGFPGDGAGGNGLSPAGEGADGESPFRKRATRSARAALLPEAGRRFSRQKAASSSFR